MKRSDAIQNKTDIIKTAIRLFRKQGLEVSLTEIAKEVGISRMTFYRHFPDKKAIVAAIFHHNLDRLATYANRQGEDDQNFFKLLQTVLRQRVEYNLYIPYIDRNEGISTSDKLFQIFEKPIERAKASGLIRKDFNGRSDLLLLIMMMGGAASHYNIPSSNHTTDRTIQLIMEGIIMK